MRGHSYAWWVTALCAFVMAGSCAKEAPPAKPLPRPVTAVKLKRLDPERRMRLTGSVKPWKEQDIGFEVSGRVLWAVDEGADVEGRVVDEKGNVIVEGTVVGRVDPTRHQLQARMADAQWRNAKASAEATRIEIEQVLPEKLKAANADLKNAEAEYLRSKELKEDGAGTQSDLDASEAAHKTARATVAQTEATFESMRAQLDALKATALQAEESLASANRDVADCVLYAPFNGRVASVDVAPGAYVSPGRECMRIVMMDPIKIEVPVSAATDRSVAYGDVVAVYPPDMPDPIIGWVQIKDTVADAATRTFNLGILARNRRIAIGLPENDEALRLPRIRDVSVVVVRNPGQEGSFFVQSDCLQEDASGTYVWHVANLDVTAMGGDPGNAVFTVKKAPVTLGKERVYVLNYTFVELADSGGLKETDALVTDAPEGLSDGGRVLLYRQRWMFRPGDLVPVVLELPPGGAGFYVPMECVLRKGGQAYVYLAEGTGIGETSARRSDVNVLARFGEMCRIEGEGIQEGALVVLSGAHYLVNDESISVTYIQDASRLMDATTVSEGRP